VEDGGDGAAVVVDVDRGGCGPTVTGVTLHVVSDLGGGEEIPLATTGQRWSGTLPAPDKPGVVSYWLSATDGTTTEVLPAAAPEDSFTAWFGGRTELWCDDFEDGLDQWTHGAQSTDAAVRGVDEWEAGPPLGLAGDSEAAPSGTAVAGLDLGGTGDGDGAYEGDLHTWLESAPVDVGEAQGVHLQFWSWLAVEDAAHDQATVLVNGAPAWSNDEGRDTEATAWRFHDVDLSEADLSGGVQVSFELDSDGAGELAGWNIDRVCLVVPAEAGPNTNPDCPDVDFVDRNNDCEPDDPRDDAGGCGCAAPARAPGPWWPGLLLFVRRRRSTN